MLNIRVIKDRIRAFPVTNWWHLILLLLLFLLLIVTRLHIPGQLLDFVIIEHEQTVIANSPGATLDEILLKHHQQLASLPRIRASLLQQSRMQEIKPFWIDRCAVEQGDFYRFMQWQRLHAIRVLPEKDQPPGWQYKTINRNHRILGRVDIPANGLSYYDASTYCRANQGRLPTLIEYQAVSGGRQGNLYPWGNQSSDKFWPYLDPMLNAVQKCDSQPHAATAEHNVHGLGHGILEWVSLSPGRPQAALMGGGVEDKPHDLYALNFVNRVVNKTQREKYAGFRCAYDRQAAVNPRIQTLQTSPWGSQYEPVLISGGSYPLGPPADSQLIKLLRIAQPREWLTLVNLFIKGDKKVQQTFNINACEVTRRQYRYFLVDPLVHLGLFGHRLQPKGWDYYPLNWEQQLESSELPVVGVDWWSAYAFAQWVGGRLPRLAEWRTAASGASAHLYPWGNQDKRKRFLIENKANFGIKACGERDLDKSADGIKDMAGNVSEWTLDIARLGDGYGVTMAGGNYMLPVADTVKTTHYSVANPEYRSMALGFRVVRD